MSRSIQFVTAHCMDDDATNAMDWGKLANPDGTLAIYMGRSQLPYFSKKLIEAGLSPDTPAAAIENGTLPTERRCFATLSTLAARASAELGDGPTLVIIGHVIDHRPQETYTYEELPQQDSLSQLALRSAKTPSSVGASRTFSAHSFN